MPDLPTLVQYLQLASGAAWLMPAVLLTTRILNSLRGSATRIEMLSAPHAFVAWVQVGFALRWLVWPHSIPAMEPIEVMTWACLYLLSTGLALWVLSDVFKTRGE